MGRFHRQAPDGIKQLETDHVIAGWDETKATAHYSSIEACPQHTLFVHKYYDSSQGQSGSKLIYCTILSHSCHSSYVMTLETRPSRARRATLDNFP